MKRSIVSTMIIGVLGAVIIAGILPGRAYARMVNGARDCDANAVIYCGVMSPEELQTKYAGNASVANIFNHFGISAADISRMNTTAQPGEITKSGNVLVNGKVVATGAVTAGRHNMPGSTKVTFKGTTFYTRSPSVSFGSGTLPALVVMENGRFAYAVLASCGNPVKAKPVVVYTPTKPAPTVVTPVSQPSAPSASQPAVDARTLPKTGVASVAGITGLTAVTGTLAHYLVTRRRYQ